MPLIGLSQVQAAPFELLDNKMYDIGNGSKDIVPKAISADGSSVVGFMYIPNGQRAFRWSVALGEMQYMDNQRTSFSESRAVSADGGTVVGGVTIYVDIYRPFRWTEALGLQDLGSLYNSKTSEGIAKAVSADGRTIVGNAEPEESRSIRRAFRWTEALGMQDLGSLRTDKKGSSDASAISADGSTIVGHADTQEGESRAIRWTEALGMQDLGSLRTDKKGDSDATAVSADGNAIVGQADTQEVDTQKGKAIQRAYRWTEALGMQDLGSLRTDKLGSSVADGVSADGSTVVGKSDSEGVNFQRAYRWTEALGMQDLGSLRTDKQGPSYATGVSADGRTVVGGAWSDDNSQRAYRWTEALGMQGLGSLNPGHSLGSYATGVSADGRTVLGQEQVENNVYLTFIYRSADVSGPGVMQDYGNVLRSFPKLAREQELAAGQQQASMSRLFDQRCFVGSAGLNCLGISGVVSNTGSDGDIGKRNQAQGLLTLGRGLSEAMTLGLTLSSGSTQLRDSGVKAKTAYGLGAWGEYSEHGAARTGLQASISVGVNKQDNDLTRGKGLSNVQQLRGSADMQTVAGRAGVGYGVAHQSGWLITPEVAVVQQHTTLDSYSENRGAITGDYKKSRLNTTVADVGINGQRALSSVSGLNLGAGIEQDLGVDRMRLKGSVDLAGLEVLNAKSQLDRKSTRPYVSADYHHDLPVGTASAGLRVASDTFSNSAQTALSVSYGLKF